MPRRKRSSNDAGSNKANGAPASDRSLPKYFPILLPDTQDCIKVKMEEQEDTKPGLDDTRRELEDDNPPDSGLQAREIPCVGCLVGLASWMPEDGEPKLCYDEASEMPGPGEDATCTRCAYHEKSCSTPVVSDEEVQEFLNALSQSPRDMTGIRDAQRELRGSLRCELHIKASNVGTFEPSEYCDDMSFEIYDLEETMGAIAEHVEGIGGRYTWRDVRGLRHATEKAGRLLSKIIKDVPPQAADFAAKELGFV